MSNPLQTLASNLPEKNIILRSFAIFVWSHAKRLLDINSVVHYTRDRAGKGALAIPNGRESLKKPCTMYHVPFFATSRTTQKLFYLVQLQLLYYTGN